MEILKRSETLKNYSIFMGKIHEYKERLGIEESVEVAVKYCIENNILKDFLKKHGSEVYNMLFEEISVEEIVAVRCEEAREEGREEERDKIMTMLSQGLSVEEIRQQLMTVPA
jgi:hypothetical protein